MLIVTTGTSLSAPKGQMCHCTAARRFCERCSPVGPRRRRCALGVGD
jgi:hypothetical protein